MALRIRFQYPSGSHLGYTIERLSDGVFFDFKADGFARSPAKILGTLPEDAGMFQGRFKANLATSAAEFTDGDYVITVHDTDLLTGGKPCVVAELACTMHGGDDATVFPAPFPTTLIATPNP